MIPLTTDQPAHRRPYFTVLLILANVFIFVVWQQEVGLARSVRMAALVPSHALAHAPGSFERLWLSMFMHGSWMHLIGNMWFLWIFGHNIEDLCGPIRYLCFYLSCGLLATMAHVFGNPASTMPMVGASGAISGVLGAYLVKYPRAHVRTLIPLGLLTRIIDFPAYFFLLLWIGLQVASQVFSRVDQDRGGVAYLAHIGGFIVGGILIFLFQRWPSRRPPSRAEGYGVR